MKDKIVKKYDDINGRKISLYAFPDGGRSAEKEIQWKEKVYNKFFRVGKEIKEQSQSSKIYKEIVRVC